MAVELSDLLGVLSVLVFLAGLGAVSVRTMLLLKQQYGKWGMIGPSLLLLTGLYILWLTLDVRSVVAVLSNQVDDIPPESTLRTTFIAGIQWLLHYALLRLAHGRAP